MPYDTSRLDTLGKRRAQLLTQISELETEIKQELLTARSTPQPHQPSQERLGAIIGITRLTVTKWLKEAKNGKK